MSVLLQVGVKAFLKNKNGKYLLIKRSGKYSKIEGVWDIVGGRINPGEPLIKNLAREIKEEVGLELKENPKLLSAQDIFVSREHHVVRLTYLASIEGSPKISSDEHTEYQWVSLKQMQRIDNLDNYCKELIATIKLV